MGNQPSNERRGKGETGRAIDESSFAPPRGINTNDQKKIDDMEFREEDPVDQVAWSALSANLYPYYGEPGESHQKEATPPQDKKPAYRHIDQRQPLPLLFPRHPWKRTLSGVSKRRKKRRRMAEGPSFDSINVDCIVNILSYLPFEDMNNISVCSRACRDARNNDSLDQTREGTIVCMPGSNAQSIQHAIVSREWNNVFAGNRTHLKIENIESLDKGPGSVLSFAEAHAARLEGVQSLDLSSYGQHIIPIINLFQLFPNITSIDLSSLESPLMMELGSMSFHCPKISRITWNYSWESICLTGKGLGRCHNLTELYLDDSCFLSFYENYTRVVYGSSRRAPSRYHLFSLCSNLKRLSILNASLKSRFGYDREVYPVSQKMLIKMVRNHLNLRWLRSDLSPRNVAMLKRERPDITFVSD